MDHDHPLDFSNQSKHSLRVYFNQDINYKDVYPDTLITNFESRISADILSNEKESVAGGSAPWKSVFEVSIPSDTLTFFVFHSDTLSSYNWQEIRNSYKILKRYDLSLKDLENLDFTVEYPPTKKMANIKQYPPYLGN